MTYNDSYLIEMDTTSSAARMRPQLEFAICIKVYYCNSTNFPKGTQMNSSQFRLALERLQPSDWEHFELLCSQFLASEHSNLRTMASPAGDGGRDSVLFSPEGTPFIAAQYSVTKSWKDKITATVKRIKQYSPEVNFLIFMSNQAIGAQADDLKRSLMTEHQIVIDTRDRNWFIERVNADPIKENAALELFDKIARPYLAGEGLIEKSSSPLSSREAKAALVHLGLQWHDDISEKGLTKLSFDALVRAALRKTHSEHRMSRADVHNAVNEVLPSSDPQNTAKETDKALKRLTKKTIRHWEKDDEFCLTHEEHTRNLTRLAEAENEENDFKEAIASICEDCLSGIEEASADDVLDLTDRVPRIIEKLLLKCGEEFASAVLNKTLDQVGLHELADIIMRDISDSRPSSPIIHHYQKITMAIVQAILSDSAPTMVRYLRRLANSYTLLCFLRETPDVKSATHKLFSHGTVWIDTTALLPVFAEQLEDDPENRRYSNAFSACINAGVKLRVTSGTLQEISGHMRHSRKCSRRDVTWYGRYPFLFSEYINSGRTRDDFPKWLELFCGTERPEDDLAQFLYESFGIKRQDLTDESLLVDDKLRFAAKRLWTEAHNKRRAKHKDDDFIEDYTEELIKHDVETYLGVIALREKEEVTELGYQHWLLTLDKNAWSIRDHLKSEFRHKTPQSPLLSLAFLLNSMSLGPARSRIGKEAELSLPLILDFELTESAPHNMLEIADNTRRENADLPEYVIRRKVRDSIDRARHSRGCQEEED